uniref:NADH dehydrogenase subunit 5 n=1 Tax=Limnocentropus hysbald TaxID=1875661 RepID=UPI0022DCE034|nr:NADH dehydrogenase subunit 5 [Limnocentropus hysbald]UZZ44124.1 NADH dehydrogenase subunit 5 [Limnocentropus hysbald]
MDILSLYLISFFILLCLSSILFFFSLIMLYNNMIMFLEWEIFTLNSSEVVFVILLDWISLVFMGVVMMISSMVIFYSESYMSKDINKNRFVLLVLMFVLSMMFMIMSPNLISILLGWDGLGLVSFCLVIYYQNIKSYNAGMLTVLSNRIGDVAILMMIAWLLNYGSWNYIYMWVYMKNDLYLMMIGSLVILAGMTKSAQIPFSSWLPAAMAAPTPVSALVHSSTLVTAGVYLLIRFFNILEGSLLFKWFLLLSSLTMFMAGMSANYEYDLKKIIALSTLSQLGLMMSILSLGFKDFSFFHLLTHAFFKALLFLCAGVLIHSFMDIQDIRFMGNIVYFMPLTGSCFMISNLSLCGFPFLAGFYSKDLILEVFSMSSLNMVIFFFFFFSTGLTVCYSFRLMYYSFIVYSNFYNLHNIYDEDYFMLVAMFILLVFSVISGSMIMWVVFPSIIFIYLVINMKFMVIYVILMGLLMGVLTPYMYLFKNFSKLYFNSFWSGLMWFMPLLSTYGLNYKVLIMGNIFLKNLDFGWIEVLESKNIYFNLLFFKKMFQTLQMNMLKIYLLIFIFWIIFLYLMLI